MLETACEVMLEAYKRNWITSRDGNISVRHYDRDHFYVSPSSTRKQTLQPDQFKKIKIHKHLQSGTGSASFIYSHEVLPYTDISENLRPSAELPLHFALQREMGQHDKDVRVVLHLHPTYCIAAMHAGIDLNSLVEEFPELGGYTRVAPTVPFVKEKSVQLADGAVENLQLTKTGFTSYDIVGLKGHGVVSVDASPWRAFEHIERLEHICKIVLAAKKYHA